MSHFGVVHFSILYFGLKQKRHHMLQTNFIVTAFRVLIKEIVFIWDCLCRSRVIHNKCFLNSNGENKLHRCYISVVVLTCFCLKKGRATFFRPETIVASFLHRMVYFSKCYYTIPQNASFWCSIVVRNKPLRKRTNLVLKIFVVTGTLNIKLYCKC